MLCSLAAANRDPNLGEDMDQVRPGRATVGSHLSFGHGIHRCLGAPLAQMEMRIALPGLLRRFPGLHVAGEVPLAQTGHRLRRGQAPVAW